MNVTDPIRRLARISPATIAVVRADHAGVTYRDLDRVLDAATAALGGLGIVAGQTVGLAIAGPDEFAGLMVALALARLGVATADEAFSPARMDVWIPEGGRPAKPGVRSVAIEEIFARLPPPGADVPAVRPHPDGSAVCRIFASSGTTGVPKFAALSHDLLARRALAFGLAMGGHGAVRICAVGLGISWGFTNMLRTLWHGGTLVLTNPADAALAIQRHRVTSLVIAPISLQQVLATRPAGAKPLPSLQAIEVSGSALSARLMEQVQERLCRNVVALFGATEAGGIASAPTAALAGHARAVGYVYPGVEVVAVDADNRVLSPGSDGILRIRSATCITGYVGDPVASAEVFRDGWFYCGDIGSVSADGMMTVSGRISEVINAGGNKVSPHVIEEVLLALPQVTDAAAFGVPDKLGVVQIWAAIVGNGRVENALLSRICVEKLGMKSPKFVLQVEKLPRNANGKLLRDELIKFAIAQQR
jgi:acyl-CoA synthetase (AMP-forming)/AMP-acid ligase II